MGLVRITLSEQCDTALWRTQCDAESMGTHIRHDLEVLHQSLLAGKLPRNLSWSDTVELVRHLGEVQPHGSDEYVFVVGTQRAFFNKPHTHDFNIEEVSRLRVFLRSTGPEAQSEEPLQPRRMVVAIDHHAAHVYQDYDDSRPDEGKTVRTYDPFGFHHHLLHRKEAHYKGEHVPEEKSFDEEIAASLVAANEIVLIGHGAGKSSAVDFLAEYLKTHHHDISRHVIATETADLSALSEPELEAIAKQHMIAVL